MIASGRKGPLRESDRQGQAPKEQQDFFNWLQRLPRDFLQELYRQYSVRRDVLDPPPKSQPAPEATKEAATEKIAPKSVIVLRRSIFVLITTLLGIEIFFDAIYIALRIPPLYLHTSLLNQMNFTSLYFIAFIVLNLFKILFMMYAAIQWLAHVYEIRENEIRYKYGILHREEKIFICSYAQEVIESQGIIGRIFNFGNIAINNPTIKEQIYLDSIPNSRRYAELIKNSLHRTEDIVPINV